jgi:hypothetical protein
METFSAAAICGGTGPGDTPLDCCALNSGMIPKIKIATQKDHSPKLLKIGLPAKVNSIASGSISPAKLYGLFPVRALPFHGLPPANGLTRLC